MKRLVLGFLAIVLSSLPVHAKRIELVLWHGMAGNLGDEVKLLADDFNNSQSVYLIRPVYKGNYSEILTSFAAAFRAHQPPAIVQIFEVGTAIMHSTQGAIKPVDELMQEQGISLAKLDFIPSIREFYSKNGQLVALPFNLSLPTLYYNADALATVGYAADNFPRTWDEMEVLAQKLKHAGYHCIYTTAYPGWILFESFLAIHGLPLTQRNPVQAAFNSPHLISHFKRLQRWHSQRYFRYAGRVDDATILFTGNVCPLFSQSSGAYNSLKSLVPFRLGIANMPLDTQISKIRHPNVAGGAALWAVAGQSNVNYKGIAQFFSFITQPKNQQRWHEHTGYLPIGLAGQYATILKTSEHPNLLLAQEDLKGDSTQTSLQYWGPQNQIRSINDEVLEAMLVGLINPEDAVHQASIRANHVLLRFARNTQQDKS